MPKNQKQCYRKRQVAIYNQPLVGFQFKSEFQTKDNIDLQCRRVIVFYLAIKLGKKKAFKGVDVFRDDEQSRS